MALITNSDSPDQLLFESSGIRIGAFRCSPDHPKFEDSGPTETYCFVFPRTAVAIEQEHERPFAANPNVVAFYNRNQAFRRRPISQDGDRCEWFGVPPEIALDAMRGFDGNADSRPERPFSRARGWSDAQTYLLQRRLFLNLCAMDPLAVEEQVIELLNRVLHTTHQRLPRCTLPGRQEEAIRHVEWLLSERLEQSLRLKDLAVEAGLSAFHLCRAFRKATGTSLHQYRVRMRLKASLEPVCESQKPLVDIALDTGFSSHSHFTSSFHREFRQLPSDLRRFRARF